MRATSRWLVVGGVDGFECFFRVVRFGGELVVVSDNRVKCSNRTVESSNRVVGSSNRALEVLTVLPKVWGRWLKVLTGRPLLSNGRRID